MRKTNESAAPQAEGITVQVSRMGNDPIKVNLAKDATVAQAIEATGIVVPAGAEMFVSGEPATSNDILDDFDVLVISTSKQAGI